MTRESTGLTGWPYLVAVVVAAIATYAVTGGFGFAYDDVHIIQQNELLHSLDNWKAILTSSWWGNALYRPLTLLTFAMDWALTDGDPGWFHIGNVVLHAAVTATVFFFVAPYLGAKGAGAAALLFAVHPVHVEAVANVVGRAELLAALFLMTAALAYRADGRLAGRGVRARARMVTGSLTLAAVGLALASKETALVAPGILLLVDWLDARMVGETTIARFRKHAVLWFGVTVMTALWLVVWVDRVGQLGVGTVAPGLVGQGLVGRTVAMAPVVLEYLRLLFVPVQLSADYSPDFLKVEPALGIAGLLGITAIVGAAILAVRLRNDAPVVSFSLAWMGGTLLVVSNVLVPGEILLAERTLYLPSVGAVLILGAVVAQIGQRWARPTMAAVVLIAVLGFIRSSARVPIWKDNETFFPQLVRDAPGSYRAQWIAAMLQYQAGDRPGGEQLLRDAVTTYPLDPAVWIDLARRVEEEKRWREAARYYLTAYELDSSRAAEAAFGIVNLVRAGAADSAAVLVHEAAARHPREFRLKIARAEIALAQGRPHEAMDWRRRVALEFPDVWQYWYITADAALTAGDCAEAVRAITRVRALRSDAPPLDELETRSRRGGCG